MQQTVQHGGTPLFLMIEHLLNVRDPLCPTWWNSTFLMIECLLNVQDPLPKVL